MSGMNPIVLIQMLMQYTNYKADGKRTFKFSKFNRMKVHEETDEEEKARKSRLSPAICEYAKKVIRTNLAQTLNSKLGRVYIDPECKKLAVPMSMSVGQTGYGTMTPGSRIDIPEGRFVRAFTYWEKVDDIDISCFALTEDGRRTEYSWRNMYSHQGMDICFSGDQTSGFYGGSEYFDIDLDLYKQNHPDHRYLVFCDNVFTGGGAIHFKEIITTAGFMIREKMEPNTVGTASIWSNQNAVQPSIFEPKTVKTSYRITTDASMAYLFAIDLEKRQMVWLNISREGDHAVAGQTKMNWILDYMSATEAYSLYDLFEDLATEVAKTPLLADVIVSDRIKLPDDSPSELIHSWDTEKIFQYLQVG